MNNILRGKIIMQKLLKHFVRLAAIAIILMLTNLSVSAAWPYNQFYPNCYVGNYSTYSQESIPYYALYPPVYYSYPVARTYGLYPFAYYAEAAPSQSVAIEPKMVRNSFVEQKSVEEPKLLSQQPLRIVNPFVEQAGVSNQVQKASWEKAISVKPKVIYPSKGTSAS
jgi:hypothetical protein